MNPRAFTLIELLVVIVVIGILSTISTSTYRGYIEDAENAKELVVLRNNVTEVQAKRIEYENGNLTATDLLAVEMQLVTDAISLARQKEKKILMDITGHYCSDCICREINYLQPLPGDETIIQTCRDRWKVVTDIIDDAASIDLSFIHTDPWGTPYFMDENEQEQSGDLCRNDSIFSAGPDGYHDVDNDEPVGDGYRVQMDFYDESVCPN